MNLETAVSAILESRLEDSKKSHAIYLLCSFTQCNLDQAKNQPIQTKQDFIEIPHSDYSEVGFVYLIKNFDNGQVKIGFSKNPQHRVKEIQTGCHAAKLVFFAKGTMDEEKYLHEVYAERRIKNEWFSLSNVDIKGIQDFLLKERTFKINYSKKGRGKSAGLEFQVIEDATVSGDFFKFKDTVSIRNLVDYSRYVSPNGSGIGKDTASVYMTMLKEKNRPLSKKQWEDLKGQQ